MSFHSELQSLADLIDSHKSLKNYPLVKSDLESRKETYFLYKTFLNKISNHIPIDYKNTREEEFEILQFLDPRQLSTNKGLRLVTRLIKKIETINTSIFPLESLDFIAVSIAPYFVLSDNIKRYLSGELSPHFMWKDGIAIHLNSNVHFNSLEQLNKQTGNWLKILRAYGRASLSNESSFKIHSIKEGSLIIVVTTVLATVYSLLKINNLMLERTKTKLEVDKLAHEFSRLVGEQNKNITISMMESARIDVEKECEKYSEIILSDNNYKQEDINEIKSLLTHTNQILFNFLLDGGVVNFLISPKSLKSLKSKKASSTLLENLAKIKRVNTIRKQLNELLAEQPLILLDNTDEDPD